jgi:hypothetical protein
MGKLLPLSFYPIYCAQKVRTRIYLEYYSVCPLVGIGTLPPPFPPASECALPPGPGTKGLGLGGGTLLRVRWGGVGESQFGRLERKLSTLSTLWTMTVPQ